MRPDLSISPIAIGLMSLISCLEFATCKTIGMEKAQRQLIQILLMAHAALLVTFVTNDGLLLTECAQELMAQFFLNGTVQKCTLKLKSKSRIGPNVDEYTRTALTELRRLKSPGMAKYPEIRPRMV